MHRHRKPIRKCHGCGLNFRDHCGVYSNPREKWQHGRCPGYGDADLLAEYERRQAADAPAANDSRRRAQELKATEPHHQGQRDPRHHPPHEHPPRSSGAK